MSKSFVRIETDGQEERLHCNYAIRGLDETRKGLLLRRVLSLLANEENRIYLLSDSQALAELDALKARQDVQYVRQIAQES